MKEIWKDIPEYEGIYMVSNLGNFKSLKRAAKTRWGGYMNIEGMDMPCHLQRSGYNYINLSKSGKRRCLLSHRIIAKVFIPNPNNKKDVNHIDGNKLNNSVVNLEWATRKENIIHAVSVLNIKMGKIGNENRNKKVVQYSLDGKRICEFKSGLYASIKTGVSKYCISKCLTGIYKTAGGFLWRYS